MSQLEHSFRVKARNIEKKSISRPRMKTARHCYQAVAVHIKINISTYEDIYVILW